MWISKLANVWGKNPNTTLGEIAARYEAFLVGTGANIMWAFIGAAIAGAFHSA